MWESEGFKVCLNILLAVFTVYLFFLYFNIFFKNRKAKYRQVIGVFVIVIWLFEIPDIIYILPLELKLTKRRIKKRRYKTVSLFQRQAGINA